MMELSYPSFKKLLLSFNWLIVHCSAFVGSETWENIIFSFRLKLKMNVLLKLSIFVLSASLTIASKKRCLKNVRRLKKQNAQLKSIIEELESDGEWGSWSGWSACRSSSFCEKGFTTRSRSCTPQGKYCEGDTLEAKECDRECPTGLKKTIKRWYTYNIHFPAGHYINHFSFTSA